MSQTVFHFAVPKENDLKENDLGERLRKTVSARVMAELAGKGRELCATERLRSYGEGSVRRPKKWQPNQALPKVTDFKDWLVEASTNQIEALAQ